LAGGRCQAALPLGQYLLSIVGMTGRYDQTHALAGAGRAA
jgi:hypothetical protein